MNNAKRFVGLAAAALIISSAAGCSAGSDGAADSDREVTVTILSGTIVEQPDGDVEQAIADAYMAENPNVTIEFIGVPSNELQPKLIAMASSGTLPDIFFNSPDFAPKSVDLGAPVDLNGVLGAEFVSGFADSGIEQATIDDALVFAPWYSIPTGLIYRADWFDEAGLTPPSTWDEFTEVAQDLTTDTDGDGENDRWGSPSSALPISRAQDASFPS